MLTKLQEEFIDIISGTKKKMGYKLLAADMHSRNTRYERLYYPETGEWVQGEIYVGTNVTGAMVALVGSLPAWWLVTVEYVLLRHKTTNIDVASQVRVLSVEKWEGYEEWASNVFEKHFKGKLFQPSQLRMALCEIAGADHEIPIHLFNYGYDTDQAPKMVGRYLLYNRRFAPGSCMVVVGEQWLMDRGIDPYILYKDITDPVCDM